MTFQSRKRTGFGDIVYSSHLCFSVLSMRNTSKALSRFVQRSHTAIRDGIQKYQPERLFFRETKVSEFIIDETQIKVGPECIWLWVAAIESGTKNIPAYAHQRKKNMFVAGRFLSNLVKDYDKHPLSADGGTWYPQACRFLKLEHHIHSPCEKKHYRKDNAVHKG
jgi:putative transposase